MKDNDNTKKVKIAVLGGSVPAGSECEKGQSGVPNLECAWPARLETMVHSGISPNVEFINLARGSTNSNAGLTQVVDLQEYDAIIIQWTTNDDVRYGENADEFKPAFETLIRTALSLPKNPAVIIYESLGAWLPSPVAEIMHSAIANVYQIPVISARAAFWRQAGFEMKDWSNNGKSVHPRAIWHKRLACLMYENWAQESKSTLDMSNYADPLDQEPVFGGDTLHCKKHYAVSAFNATLEHAPSFVSEGWSYYADAPSKFGYISDKSGSVLQFEIPHQDGIVQPVLYIHYMRSYTPEWGKASVVVSPGGMRRPKIIDSHGGDKSQIDVIKIELKSSDEPYTVTIKNFRGGKVKIVELFLMSCA